MSLVAMLALAMIGRPDVLAGSTASSLPAPAGPGEIIAHWVQAQDRDRPRISLWLNRETPYDRGDAARVYLRVDRDAYVTVVRIDTDGRMRILFPVDPWEDSWARGGRTFEVLGRDRDEAFRVSDYPGEGYIFAIASEEPFDYEAIVRGDHWDYRAISDGRVRGDPYVAVSDLAEQIAPTGAYDYDVQSYDVERHYDYPRFLCYDCHMYTSWRYWDPYGSHCSQFRIVIYDDWYYYPYRRYRGATIVVRPTRPGPRYVFRDSDPRNDYISRVGARPRRGDSEPAVDRGRTSADVGGRGAIPAPNAPRRRTPEAAPGGESGSPRRRSGGVEPSPAPGGREQDRSGRREAAPPSDPAATPDDRPSRPETGRGRDRGDTREAPPADQPDRSPRRHPGNDHLREPGGGRESPGAEPRRDGGGDRPSGRAEPPRSRPEPRSRPDDGGARSAPPADRPRAAPERKDPPPKSTGDPELKRRRP